MARWIDTLDPIAITGRLLYLFFAATPSQQHNGLQWYADARRDAERISRAYDVEPNKVCGVIAALSPQAQWEVNLDCARESVAAGTATRARCSFPKQHLKANRILAGEHPNVVLTGPKENAFYRCIADPSGFHKAVTIDRHAVRAALGDDVDPQTILGRAGAYAYIADRYREAATMLRCVRPLQVQAVTWVVQRELLSDKGVK